MCIKLPMELDDADRAILYCVCMEGISKRQRVLEVPGVASEILQPQVEQLQRLSNQLGEMGRKFLDAEHKQAITRGGEKDAKRLSRMSW